MDKLLDRLEAKFSRLVAARTKLAPDTSAYYHLRARVLSCLVLLETAAIVGLTVFLCWLISGDQDRALFYAQAAEVWAPRPDNPLQTAVADKSRMIQMFDIGAPNMGRETISAWAANAAGQIMTFGFNDIDARFDLSKQNFTEKGWERFRKAMIESGLIDTMTNTQQLLTSVPKSVPVLQREGLVEGVYSWAFKVPLLMTFRAGAQATTKTATAYLVIERVSTRINPRGVGISEWYLY